MKNITKTQLELLELINIHKPETGIFEYNEIKKKCYFPSFDLSFNALLFKGHVRHFTTSKNTFITTIK